MNWLLYYGADAATGAFFGGNDVLLTAVPEPGAAMLLLLGLAGLALAARSRNRS
jgi:hypothetical protein